MFYQSNKKADLYSARPRLTDFVHAFDSMCSTVWVVIPPIQYLLRLHFCARLLNPGRRPFLRPFPPVAGAAARSLQKLARTNYYWTGPELLHLIDAQKFEAPTFDDGKYNKRPLAFTEYHQDVLAQKAAYDHSYKTGAFGIY